MPCHGPLVTDCGIGRPHVVILGAGASRAACPSGDKHGRQLPLMRDLVETAGLEPILSSHGVPYCGEDFEELYSSLCDRPNHASLTEDLQAAVRRYFSAIALPDEPTLYDHLVLSLRGKDLIASFNWDPLLAQACIRNRTRAELPHVVFVHGNVAVGYCSKDKVMGPVQSRCPKCGRPYPPSRLLYPTTQKDYSADPYVSTAWKMLRGALKDAYVLTIFGYGGPRSDAVALRSMQQAWGRSATRELGETEIIDIRTEDELGRTWACFICEHHYRVHNSFYKSLANNFPRRSCEAVWRQTMEVEWLDATPIPTGEGFAGLYSWLDPLFGAEPPSVG